MEHSVSTISTSKYEYTSHWNIVRIFNITENTVSQAWSHSGDRKMEEMDGPIVHGGLTSNVYGKVDEDVFFLVHILCCSVNTG